MARYRRYGELDDTPIEDLEIAFKGFNNRLRPDQLPRGVLHQSLNGRMEIGGEWQPRKGVDLILAPFSSAVLDLPFVLYDSLPAVGAAGTDYSRLGEVLTVNFASAHGVADGEILNLSGLSVGSGVNPNGNRAVTYVDADTLDITIAGMTAGPTGTLVVTGAKLDDDQANQIYGAVAYYDPNSSNDAYVILAGNEFAVAINLDTNAQTTISYPTDEILTASVDMKQYLGQIYIFRDGEVSMVWDGDLSGSPAFALVSRGVYTDPVTLSPTGFTITNGLAIATVSNSLSIGDEIVLTDPGGTDFTAGDTFVVASASGSQFTFYVDHEDVGTVANTEWLPHSSDGVGFTHLPAPPWAESHQGRLVMPWNYTMAGTSGTPVITDRNLRDEIIFTRIRDPETCDKIYGQFKFSPEKSDYVVALHSFSDDQLVVLNRESIYVVSNSTILRNAVVTLVTNELGCVARDSIQQIGNKLMFLSDNGVYALDFQDLYNLRGQDLPLSESIDQSMKTINLDYASGANAVYFDNRYYLAVPTGNSIVNNALFVYSFLNREWVSIDTVNDAAWDYKSILVAGDKASRGVYAINTFGGLHRLDYRIDAVDVVTTQFGGTEKNVDILGTMDTRAITGGSVNRKKWNGWDIHIESSETNDSDADITATVENIDAIIDLGSVADYHGQVLEIGESASLRGRFGNRRGYSVRMKIATTRGRPKIRAIKFTGSETFRGSTEAS